MKRFKLLILLLLSTALTYAQVYNAPPDPNELNDNSPKTSDIVELNGLILVQGGTFQMGSKEDKDSRPIHSVRLSNFYMGKHNVTFEEYDRFCQSTNKSLPKDEGWGRGNRPVINVSWFDAIEYCNWLSKLDGYTPVYRIDNDGNTRTVEVVDWEANGYRLPTEAEWEYAARGGNRNEKWAGTSSKQELYKYSNCFEKGKGRDRFEYTAPVGSFSPNDLGIYDLSGNVFDWCFDWYNEDYSFPNNKNNPKGPNDHSGTAIYKTRGGTISMKTKGFGRIVRGGSYYHHRELALSTKRGYAQPYKGTPFIGFRLVRKAQ